MRNRLGSSRSRAGAFSEYAVPVFLVVDSGLKELRARNSPVGFGADHKAQNVLLRTSIAVSRGDGDLAKDSLDNRNPLYSIAFPDCNEPIRLLNGQ